MKNTLAYYFSPERYTNIFYQLLFITITALIIGVHVQKFVTEFHPPAHIPFVQPLTPEVIAQWGKNPEQVAVGMHIADFLRFDTVKNEFIINAFVWFRFNADKLPLSTIEKFSFTKGEFLQKSEPIVKKMGELTQAIYTIRLQFSSILDYSRFPIDDHRIFLNLTNPAIPADQMVFDTNNKNFIVSKNLYLSGWDIIGHSVNSGFTPLVLGEEDTLLQPKAVFSLDLSKSDQRQLALIFFPLLFLYFLALVSFSIRDINIALPLPLASFSGLLGYSFVIQTLAPAVGYIMLSDKIFFFFLFSVFTIFLIKGLSLLPEHIVSQATMKKIEGITIPLMHLALIIMWFTII